MRTLVQMLHLSSSLPYPMQQVCYVISKEAAQALALLLLLVVVVVILLV
jgi:hypothetical protein